MKNSQKREFENSNNKKNQNYINFEQKDVT